MFSNITKMERISRAVISGVPHFHELIIKTNLIQIEKLVRNI